MSPPALRTVVACAALLACGCLNEFDDALLVEGYGSGTRGANSSPDGFRECAVTSLASTGAGTLAGCLAGGRVFVRFDVAGEIAVSEPLVVNGPYVTIAGETAPPPGITIRQVADRGRTAIATHDVIVRYLRMHGWGLGMGEKIWELDGRAGGVSRVAIHHVTVRDGIGAFDALDGVAEVTVSDCLVMDQSFGISVQGAPSRRGITILRNVFARTRDRQPLVEDFSREIDVINNVVHGWGDMGSGLHVGLGGAQLNAIGNAFVLAPPAQPNDAIVLEATSGVVYLDQNVTPAGEEDRRAAPAPVAIQPWASVVPLAVEDLATRVVPRAGTHHPDANERALLELVAGSL